MALFPFVAPSCLESGPDFRTCLVQTGAKSSPDYETRLGAALRRLRQPGFLLGTVFAPLGGPSGGLRRPPRRSWEAPHGRAQALDGRGEISIEWRGAVKRKQKYESGAAKRKKAGVKAKKKEKQWRKTSKGRALKQRNMNKHWKSRKGKAARKRAAALR